MRALTNEMVAVKAEIKKMQGKSDEQFATLEPIKNYFLQGISAQNDYQNADPDEKKEMLSELLWNLSVKDKIVQDFRFKPIYEVIAKEPKPSNFAMMCPGWDSNPHDLTITTF